jgi:hypothetical protein
VDIFANVVETRGGGGWHFHTQGVGCFHPRVPETSLNLGIKYKQDRPFLSIQGLAPQATFVLSIASRPVTAPQHINVPHNGRRSRHLPSLQDLGASKMSPRNCCVL